MSEYVSFVKKNYFICDKIYFIYEIFNFIYGKKKFICDKMYCFSDKINFIPDKNVVKRYRLRFYISIKFCISVHMRMKYKY